MIDTGLLLGTAQIAITVAGFGAVATSLAAKGEEGWKDATRMVILMSFSVGSVVAALTPIALALFRMSEGWVWRVSAILALIVGLALGPWQLARVRRALKGGVSFITIVPNLVLGVGMLVAYGLCALNIPAGNLDASYFAGLAASVTVGVILLFRITYSMLLPAKPD